MNSPAESVLSAAQLALAIKRFKAERPDAGALAADPIAIVGIGCRFPGDVRSPEDCWRILANGVDVITEVPDDRWPANEYFNPDPTTPGKTNGRWGGFVSDPALFDPLLFGISPREAASIDPQQRLLLEVAWESIQDSGRSPESLAGTRTGVFVGICLADYERLAFQDDLAINANTCTGAYRSVAAGRISFLLDLRGPSICIDTACSSSLVAIHSACQSLRSGESDLALAGGVSLHLLPEHYIGLARLSMLSPDGRCKTFDAKADGFVPSEGCGVVVLKRLSDALGDGDRIYAVVRGSAINQDGRTNSLTAPSGLSQAEVVSTALRNAQVPPSSISYVETHGTGTVLGDPIEVEALASVLGAPGEGVPSCVLGAAKSNFGHLEAAAGVAGLIKVALSLHKEEIPANLHFEKLNPHISLEGTRFHIPTQSQPWLKGQIPRFAGVSSFGFSGTNAHVVLEEAPRVPARRTRRAREGASVLVISARTPAALNDAAREYRSFLTDRGRDVPLQDICHAAAARGSHYEERLALTESAHAGMCALMDEFLEGRLRSGISSGRASGKADSPVFVCSGQGSQWPGMGVSLLRHEPVFRAAIEECEAGIKQWAGWSLIEQLSLPEAQSKLADTEYAQPAIFAIEVALARLLDSWGVRPAVVIGHSAGEVAAAHIAGVLSLGEAARVVVCRGRLMQAATGHGKMLVVHLPAAIVFKELIVHGPGVSIAAINSPQSTVISGDSEIVDRLAMQWQERGVGCVAMPVKYAFHSPQMQPYSDDLARSLGSVEARHERIPIVSTVLGRAIHGEEMDAAYWGRNIRQTVMFQAAVQAAARQGRDFIEIGPHPVLVSAIGECLSAESNPAKLIPTLRRNHDDLTAVLSAAGALYTAGHPIAWEAIYGKPATSVSLPAYPYQRQRFWLERRTPAQRNAIHPLLGRRLRSPSLRGAVFEVQLDARALPYLSGHKIEGCLLVPMTAFLEIAYAAVRQVYGEGRALADVTIVAPLVLTADGTCTVQIVMENDEFRVFSLREEAWTLHAHGRIVPAGSAGPARENPPPDGYSSSAAHYARLAKAGVDFGPAFRTVEAVRTAKGEAWARVSLQEPEKHEASQYLFHPALLDGCLQAAVAAMADSLDGPYLPLSLDRWEIFQTVPGTVWAHATLLPISSSGLLAADIDLRDAAGIPTGRLAGLRMKRRSAADSRIYSIEWRQATRGQAVRARSATWLIVGDKSADSAELAKELRDRGHRAIIAGSRQPIPEMEGVDGVIRLGDPDVGSALELILGMLRVTASTPPQLWLVTRGAVAVNPGEKCEGLWQAPLWGMMRTMTHEHPELRCVRVDLDSNDPDYASLAEELVHWDGEEETAFRGRIRYVSRLIRKSAGNFDSVRWTAPARGSVEKLTLAPLDRRAPGFGEVEVEVEASALNFRDVLNIMGMYPGDAGDPGLEFCGRITRLGPGVTANQPGDRVMGLAFGAMASFVTTPAALTVLAPPGWGPIESAAAPNAFLTAWHCLMHLGGLRHGERVLIHAGTGGVGLAAIQVARQAGAEIFATAGSEEKRAYLRSLGIPHVLSSRTLDFAAQIADITGGKGVDLILNSLAGDFIGASFSSLAESGRFIEIGKNRVWTKDQVAALRKQVQYFVVDLATVIESDPTLIQSELAGIRDALMNGTLQPLPAQVFDFADAHSAFLYMAQARHIGKIVLRHATGLYVDRNATYLIAGGLGAVGLHAASWLAERGARHLVLVGRTEPGRHAAERVEAIRRSGVRVEVRTADIACRPQIDSLLRDIKQNMPRLAGVFHAAGILDDGIVAHQTPDRIAAVMAPKTAGAWNLHELTAGLSLDFFILCSSVASVFGSPSQAGYSAGNAFLDALAHYRRARGLPALSVNWGAWADAGMAARVEQQGHRRALSGVRSMPAQDCLQFLEQATASLHPQVVIADIDWAEFSPSSHLTASFAPGNRELAASTSADDLLERLEVAPALGRRKILVDYLRDLTLRILGLDSSHVVDDRQPLVKIGLDSLMAIEFRNRLSTVLKRSLSATLLFDCPSISSLADFLEGPKTAKLEAEKDEAADRVLELVTGLSESQAEELLRQELERS